MRDAADEAGPRQVLHAASATDTRRRLARRIPLPGIRRQTIIGWLFVVPALVMYGVFVLQPLALTVQYSLYRWDGVGPSTWVGLSNYVAVLSEPKLVETLFNAFRLVIFYSLIPVALGLVTASVIHRVASGRLGTVSRTVLFLPQVIPLVAAGIIWGRLLSLNDPNVAFLNHMLEGLWCQREMFDQIDEGIGGLLADAARIACTRGALRTPAHGDASPVEFALRNLGDPGLGTAMICGATGLSARAVQKAFVRKAALTPTAFITTRRLARAADLLACSDGRSITDIAFEVGFSDSAFFSRCFRRSYGVAPSQWRERSSGVDA